MTINYGFFFGGEGELTQKNFAFLKLCTLNLHIKYAKLNLSFHLKHGEFHFWRF